MFECLPPELRQWETPERFYDKMCGHFQQLATHTGDEVVPGVGVPAVEFNRLFSELTWYRAGRPFYRISNDVLPLFTEISLDIPCEMLAVPYPAFTLQLEIDNPLRGSHARQVKSLLVHSSQDDRGVPCINLWVDLGEKDKIVPEVPTLNYVHCELHAGTSVQSQVHALPIGVGGSDLAEGHLDEVLMRLAISVSFLATSSDKLIRPDVLSKDLAKWLEAARKDNTEQMNVIAERAFRRKGRGYVVSLERERQLLHAMSKGQSTGEVSGRELQHSHMRAGHFRHFSKTGKVVFIRPTIVRPDLPSQ